MAHLPRARGSWRTVGRAAFVALFAASVLPIQGAPADPRSPVIDVRPLGTGAASDWSAHSFSAAAPSGPDTTGPVTGVLARGIPAGPEGPLPDAPDPSTAYEQAMAHAADDLEFTPGERVTVGFKPRQDDGWVIDGETPVALPAGRVSGRDMAVAPQGSTWAEPGAGRAIAPAGGGKDDSGGPSGSGTPVPDGAPTDQDVPSDSGDGGRGRDLAEATAVSWVPQAPVTEQAQPDPAAAAGLRRHVFGFLPYWELSNASSKLNYDVLSTIAYFSVGANGAGNLRKKDADGSRTTGWGGWTSSNMTRVINDAHARGTRVVLTISVFAWTSSQRSVQRSLLGSSAARANLARQAAAAVRDRGADGINLDFEPLASGYEREFVALLRTMRAELNKIRKGYQLTYDTTGYVGNYPLEASVASGAADAIFVMGYDYRTSRSSKSGSIDPLSGRAYDLTDTVRAYTSRVPPGKVILGLPWYGRAWSTASADPRSANISGAKYGYSTAVNYENVAPLVAKHGRRWDSVEQSPYIAYRRQNCTAAYGCVTSWRQVWYDDARSLKLRLAMVNEYGLRGAGMWALGYDGGRAEIYRAFAESFLVDKSAPQAGVLATAATQRDEGFVVKWAARDVSSIASYDVQVSVDGGAWTDWRVRTKATSDVYLGRNGHGYAFRVRARDTKGNTGAYTTPQVWTASPPLARNGFGRVVKDGLSYRSGPGSGSMRLGALPKGTIVAITRGPVVADGYTWFEVTQPIREWSPVSFVERGVWVAASGGGSTFIKPYRSPASTKVSAGITGLDFGPAGSRGTGSSADALVARAFSPGSDGSKDVLRIRWTSSAAFDSLKLRVFKAGGKLIGSVPVGATGSGSRAFAWDGRIAGTRVPDGRYMLQLVGSRDGIAYTAPSTRPVTAVQLDLYAVTVDTVPPSFTSASASGSLISPNGDGSLESVRLAFAATGGVIRWAVTASAPSGTVVRSMSGTGASARVAWNGKDDAGRRVADGRYTIRVMAYDAAGNRATKTFRVTVDTTAPAIVPSVMPRVFSPDGDGALETTMLAWTAGEAASGTARIYKGTTLVRSWRIDRLSRWSTAWDGRRKDGTAVADGKYRLKVSLTDAAGNTGTGAAAVVVDRTARRLRWAGSFYPQDGDALRATSRLTWTLTRDATTTLRIHDASGRLVRTVWTGKAQRAGTRGWTWNGRLADGTYAPQGVYTARLTVTSRLGTVELARPVRAAAFAITTSATRVKPGQTLTVTVRSVEPLAARPVVKFAQPGRAAVKVTATRLANGAYRAVFTVRSGGSGTAVIKVVGTDTGGRVNTSSTTVRVAA